MNHAVIQKRKNKNNNKNHAILFRRRKKKEDCFWRKVEVSALRRSSEMAEMTETGNETGEGRGA